MKAAKLFSVSALVLLFELALIRFLGTELPSVGFFKNLILIASFLGLGVGLNLRLGLGPALLLYSATAMLPFLVVLGAAGFGVIGDFGGLEEEAILLPTRGREHLVQGIALVCVAFASTLVPMVFLGRLLGHYFDAFEHSLRAYGWNILGSLAGALVFPLVSFFAAPPSVWFSLCTLLLLCIAALETPRVGARVALAAAVLGLAPVALASYLGGEDEHWTPYYKVSLYAMEYKSGETTGFGLRVNNTWFQRSFDARLLGRPEEVREDAHAARNLRFIAPLTLARPQHVLVLGSGLGNDTAAALRFGAESVTSVDIDPAITRLSDDFHPNRPYRDPRVRLVTDDARHFLTVTDEKFDLILFGVLEARSLFSQFSNLRLDNYVYTREAIALAYDRLAPGGVLWLNMWIPKDWVVEKFVRLMTEVVGEDHAVFHGVGSAHYSFVACRECDADALQALEELPGVRRVEPKRVADVDLPTDDWPYVFFRNRGLPLPYIVVLGLLIIASLVPMRVAYPELFRIQWGFFFLGAGFLLLETSAVTRLALVAGTTWVVNSFVFTGVLIFIFAANAIASRWKITRTGPLFVGLGLTLILANAFPFPRLLNLPNGVAIAVAAGVLTVPVLFAGVIFSSFLRTAPVPSRALGSNLLGAVLGGLAEYSSMLTGNRAVPLIALAGYLLAWLSFRRAGRAG